MSRGQNSGVKGNNICSRAGAGGTSINCADDGSGLKLAKGRRAKRARIKRGMRGSEKRAKRHRLRTFKLTNKGMCNDVTNMTADEVKEHLGRRKSKNDDLSPKEEEELLDKGAKDIATCGHRRRKGSGEREKISNDNKSPYSCWGLDSRNEGR